LKKGELSKNTIKTKHQENQTPRKNRELISKSDQSMNLSSNKDF